MAVLVNALPEVDHQNKAIIGRLFDGWLRGFAIDTFGANQGSSVVVFALL
ncbi:hypothetical protein ACFQUU_26935 [Herbaspirillum sp. GCM10030257]